MKDKGWFYLLLTIIISLFCISVNFIDKIRDFRSNLMEQARLDSNPEVVYQLNLNFFPLSEKTAGKSRRHT